MRFTKETARRALRTFWQAFAGIFAVQLPTVDFSSGKESLRAAGLSLLASGIAAGLAALLNLEEGGAGEDRESID